MLYSRYVVLLTRVKKRLSEKNMVNTIEEEIYQCYDSCGALPRERTRQVDLCTLEARNGVKEILKRFSGEMK